MLGPLVLVCLLGPVSSNLNATTGALSDEGLDIGIGLLQQNMARQEKSQMFHGLSGAQVRAGQDCNEEHYADLYRPIRQVLAEHPGVEGNCWFHFYADYLGDPENFAEDFKRTVAAYSVNAGKGKELPLYLTNGEKLTTHLDGNWGLYPYDDAMCYLMGWMKGQRLDEHVMKMQDREAWLEVAEAECRRLPEMLEGDLDESKLSIGYMADDNARIMLGSGCLALPPNPLCKRATVEDYVYHLYPKCLLGGDRLTGAAGQIEWCFARACVTEGNVIRHGDECWPDGLPF